MIANNFIVFEGIDGSGTTTQLHLIEKAYHATGRSTQVRITREPTNNEIGKLIRRVLSGTDPICKEARAALFAADRAEHIYGEQGILAALNSGAVVFSDRYLFSSLAYQQIDGAGNLARQMNKNFPLPEIVFFFDIPADAAMARVLTRNNPTEIYEQLHFQEQVRSEYIQIFNTYTREEPAMRIITIDAAQSIEKIHQNIWNTIQHLPIL